jgi:hypothetical protein
VRPPPAMHRMSADPVRPGAETMPQPKAGDAWVLRHILHDWNDADAARILAAMRAAMGSTPVTLCLCEVSMPRLPHPACFCHTGRVTRADW